MASPIAINDSTSIGNTKGVATLLIVIVALVIVVIFFKKIMGGVDSFFEGIGLKDTKQEKANKDNIQSQLDKENNKGVTSAWSPNFFKNAPGGAKLFNAATGNAIAKIIWDSVGLVYDTPANGEGAIKQCKTKSQVSYVSYCFYNNYKVDLLGWLENKYDTSEQKQFLSSMLDYVKSLPDYNI